MMTQERCPYCMQSIVSGVCAAACGGISSATQDTSKLPLGTMLNNRYCLGAELATSRQAKCYAAYDEQDKRAVLVEEFYPTPLASRQTSTLLVAPKVFKTNYEEAMQRFFVSKQLRLLPLLDTFKEFQTAYRVYRPSANIRMHHQAMSLLDIPIYFRDEHYAPLMSINALSIPPLPATREWRPKEKFDARAPKVGMKKRLGSIVLLGLGLLAVFVTAWHAFFK